MREPTVDPPCFLFFPRPTLWQGSSRTAVSTPDELDELDGGCSASISSRLAGGGAALALAWTSAAFSAASRPAPVEAAPGIETMMVVGAAT